LQGCFEALLDIHIAEGEARAGGWGQEFLTEEQSGYVVSDVKSLIPELGLLNNAPAAKQLLEHYEACCDFIVVRATTDQFELDDLFSD